VHVLARKTDGRRNCIKGEKEEIIMGRRKTEGSMETSNKAGGRN
jgi:hypothetical protein